MTSPYALNTEIVSGIAIITIDLPGESVNTLSAALVDAFESAFQKLEQDTSVVGAVLRSGKAEGFIAGADIEQLVSLRSAEDASSKLRRL